MIIGVLKEIKDNENRIALTPAGVSELKKDKHEVLIQKGAGEGSGISDKEYQDAGARIVTDASEVWANAEMVMKVKEPISSEYEYFRKGQILFTYLHLAADRALTEVLMNKGVTAVAYETVESSDGSLPLLMPMSEVAGRMATIIGAQYLQRIHGGRGLLPGGVPGVLPANVVIIGGGTVGINAAKMAVGLGADVTIFDLNANRLRYLDDIFGARVKTVVSSAYNLSSSLTAADLVIGAVLVTGAKAPTLVTMEMLENMPRRSVIIDVAVDQGGCIETSRPTTHSNPTFEVNGVLHYCVANMPGAVPRTSTYALSNVTLPYARVIARNGIMKAINENGGLAKGVNVIEGKITCRGVAEAHSLDSYNLKEVI
ncbi:alanine dehydrogenase [Desulfoscipio gibsoniae]|uniref:Alanine dehydrogenase n=1 Tax=Desulfoscipio gibsoniae DSM 7213 TaxID=767817 RepID=R4KRT0_9FIRM|nr:alanine dehydrogenase [Desulfoscipio gibsoniae]AGL02311.1 alanine dehydrogenase [Desulfoscipio gibsoniae DSM 7213]